MATPYSNVYNLFLAKISDYSFANMTQEELESIMHDYLKVAAGYFDYYCSQNLDMDDTNQQFLSTLTSEEENILSLLMVVEYLKSQLLSAEKLRMFLSDKDYKIYSQANHIRELKELYDSLRNEAEGLISRYTFKRFGVTYDGE